MNLYILVNETNEIVAITDDKRSQKNHFGLIKHTVYKIMVESDKPWNLFKYIRLELLDNYGVEVTFHQTMLS
jgi:hypothetical protein